MTIHDETPNTETQADDAANAAAVAETANEIETASVPDGAEATEVAADNLKGMAEAMQAATDAEPPRPGNEEGDKPKEEAKPEAAKTEAKEEPKPEAEQDPEKEADALGLKGKSRERFQQLNERVKTESARAETAEAGLREWQDTIASTRATPEQFGKTMGYLRAISSGDPAQMNQGFEMLVGEVQALAKILGRPVPGMYDPLDQHPDLKAAVDNMEIDRKHAEELAANRARQSLEQQGRDAADRQASEQAAFTAQVDEAKAGLGALGAQLRQQDPDFDRKMVALAPAIALIEKQVHPSQWVAAFGNAYMQLPAMPAPPAPAPVAAPSRQPMRPTGANSGGAPKFENPMDAMRFGIDRARAAGL